MKSKKLRIAFVALAVVLCAAITVVLPTLIKGNKAPFDTRDTNNYKNTNTPKLTAGIVNDARYTAKILSINYFEPAEDIPLTVIKTRAELENFPLKANNDPTPHPEYYTVPKNQYLDSLFSHCSEDFFKKKMLIFFSCTSGSGSITHSVEGLEITENGKLIINFNTNIPESGTCNMAKRLIVIEIEKAVGITNATEVAINNIKTTAIVSDSYKAEFHKHPRSDNNYDFMFNVIDNYDKITPSKSALLDKYTPDFFKEKSLMILNLNNRKENELTGIELSTSDNRWLIFTVHSDDKEGPSCRWEIIIETDKEQAQTVKNYSIDIIYK